MENYCIECGNLTTKSQRRQKFCSVKCRATHQKKDTNRRILEGEKVWFRQIRRYLIETRGEKCEECGWNKKNPITDTVPLDMDHVDGNHENNELTNLRLLCPNCHSLTPTYKGLNKGNGRSLRMKLYHKNK
jgi:hypothetical protein